jgi:hypothetical protein
MKFKIIFSLLFLVLSIHSFAVRRYPPRMGDLGFYGDPNTYPVNAGDTVVLRASEPRSYFLFVGYRGDANNWITIINEGGQVQVSAIGLEHCHYVQVVGNGTSGTEYGFKLDGNNDQAPAINIYGRAQFIRLEYFWSIDHGLKPILRVPTL